VETKEFSVINIKIQKICHKNNTLCCYDCRLHTAEQIPKQMLHNMKHEEHCQ